MTDFTGWRTVGGNQNDDSLYGYRSATIFSSLMNLDVSHLFQSLYMEGGKISTVTMVLPRFRQPCFR